MADTLAATGAAPRRIPLVRLRGIVAVFAVLIITLTALAPGFATLANLSNVLVQASILLLLALPMTLVIMSEGIDMSVGAMTTFAALCFATVATSTGSIGLALTAGLCVALCIGIFNGVVVSQLNIPPFVATLGMLGIAQGLSLVISGGSSIVGMPDGLGSLYFGSFAGIAMPVWIGAGAYALFHVLLHHTRFGVYVFAVGGNREALALAGVSPQRIQIAVYGLMGLMAGCAAVLMTARLNSAHPTAALGLEFDAIAAVAVGGTSFERGNGWLLGTLLGVLTVTALRNGLNLLAFPSAAQVSAVGVLVVLALFLEGLRSTHK